ncbi:hypothetical protein [Luteimonas vadosa]|uniref:Cation transport regulator ChaB n=1 Tax=Luteimonas vadosa TaxID=1165507 RepID=A0ABP9E4H6_9GAMM
MQSTINQNEYNRHFEERFQKAPYYQQDKDWNDYRPAYQYGYDQYTSRYKGRKFDEVENDLERGWESTKANSRLAWNEAKEAVRDGWHYIERALPGDADGDGR